MWNERWGEMNEVRWIYCPMCKNKTHTKIRGDTELKNFPLFCPKCKQETIISAQQLNISVIKEPDAEPKVKNFGSALFYIISDAPPKSFREGLAMLSLLQLSHRSIY